MNKVTKEIKMNDTSSLKNKYKKSFKISVFIGGLFIYPIFLIDKWFTMKITNNSFWIFPEIILTIVTLFVIFCPVILVYNQNRNHKCPHCGETYFGNGLKFRPLNVCCVFCCK